MLTVNDKMKILRSASFFIETPDDVLSEAVSLLEQVEVPAGETIFNKGEPGTCMYLIVEGRVRVHDGDLTLNHLGRNDVFGEMAVLDAEPRVASVTAVEDTVLLRLDQAPFYDFMANRVEVSYGIIRVLCQYLRARVRDVKEDYTYIQQMGRIMTAAAALEGGVYNPEILDEVTVRTDALGQLARVFKRMAAEVYGREQKLRSQIQELKIEIDEIKKAREVSEITESEYFQNLQKRAKELRKGYRNES